MFNKKSCNKCGKKINKDFEYCPYCGNLAEDSEKQQKDYGFLGRDDLMNDVRLPFGFNTVFKRLMKEMDRQFKQLDREMGRKNNKQTKIKDNNIKQGGISINISSGAGRPIIKVKSFGNMPEFKEMEGQFKNNKPSKRKMVHTLNSIDEGKAREFAKLPREEASSKVRRLSGKVVYEIDLPDVKDSKDIVIQQLENSIEIKAFAKDKAYFKFLPVNLPLERYKFEKGKLILELGEN